MDNRVIGVFGCSIVLGRHSLASSLSSVMALGLFHSETISAESDKEPLVASLTFKLSKREMDCLQLAIKGYTAKKIAKVMNISYRTVEEYLINIRMKTGAGSKAELIEMFHS
jgi:DNA-binding CsgD family transcriptional regulator